MFLTFQKPNHIFGVPYEISNSGCHCWRHPQGLVDLAEIVVHIVECDCCCMVLKFFGERIGQTCEATYVHSHGQVLPLDIAGRNVIAVRVAANDLSFDADALGRGIPRFVFQGRLAINLNQHCVIHIRAKCILNACETLRLELRGRPRRSHKATAKPFSLLRQSFEP